MEKHQREETQKRFLKNDLYQLIVVLRQYYFEYRWINNFIICKW